MFNVVVKSKFSSAHFLRNYDGKCENLHGHNYVIEVMVSSDKLNNEEMVMDFTILKSFLKEILNKMDHFLINDLDYFKNHNPTSENIACFIYYEIKKKIGNQINLKKVRIWETDEQYAEYYEN